jgi:hypothetical protein
MADNEKPNDTQGEDEGKGFEMFTGLVLAIFAAILAVTDLYAGKYGDDEKEALGEKNNQYSWYQSKDQKKTQQEMQKILFESELENKEGLANLAAKLNGASPDAPTSNPALEETRKNIEGKIAKIDAKIKRYEIEKNIIMDGAKHVAPEKMDEFKKIDEKSFDEMKETIGAKEWESKAAALGEAGDQYDLATLFLQMCLVLGAIALVLQQKGLKYVFVASMIGLGVIGSIYTYLALTTSWAAAALLG